MAQWVDCLFPRGKRIISQRRKTRAAFQATQGCEDAVTRALAPRPPGLVVDDVPIDPRLKLYTVSRNSIMPEIEEAGADSESRLRIQISDEGCRSL